MNNETRKTMLLTVTDVFEGGLSFKVSGGGFESVENFLNTFIANYDTCRGIISVNINYYGAFHEDQLCEFVPEKYKCLPVKSANIDFNTHTQVMFLNIYV